MLVFLLPQSQFLKANPDGLSVIHGQAQVDTAQAGILSVTNTPGAILQWQNFSIDENEITRFIQQNSQSTVLNRVVGLNPSQILGQLHSNGRVFLINPNGILFGANARVDTQGFLASSLSISNQNFRDNQFIFTAGDHAGAIENQGLIKVGENGSVILMAPEINNEGVISSEGGDITLLAGKQITLSQIHNPDIQFQIQAPEDAVVNLGQIVSHGGDVDLFGGTLKHSGEIDAGSLQLDANGNITMVAQKVLELGSSSQTLSNSENASGGEIALLNQQGDLMVDGVINASGHEGGTIELLGERVALLNDAHINASGTVSDGGEILIGGDYRGENVSVKNADMTFVDEDVSINADAGVDGQGGRVIVWADSSTQMLGAISATGGNVSGDGGFIETSGHYLNIGEHVPDASANNGQAGTWLLDPEDIEITTLQSGNINQSAPDPVVFSTSTAGVSTIDVANINTALNAGNNVEVVTFNSGSADLGNITVNAPIAKTGGGNVYLQLQADNDIIINQSITSTVGTMEIRLPSDSDGVGGGSVRINANLDSNGANILTFGGFCECGSGTVIGGNAIVDGALTANTISLSSGTFVLNNATQTIGLTLTGGILGGVGDLTVSGTVGWSGGTMDGVGKLITGSPVVSTLNGDSITLSNGRVWNNSGTINWSGDGSSFDSIFLNTSSVLNNLAGGVFNDTTAASSFSQITGQATGVFNNQGTFNKTGTTESRTSTITFNNDSAFNVSNGLFNFTSGGTDTGTYTVNTPGVLRFGGGVRTFNAGVNLSGSGQSQLTSGTLTIPAGTTVSGSNTLISGGTLNGGGTLLVGSVDTLTLNGGTLDGSGILDTQSGSVTTMNGDSVTFSNGFVWNNGGTINWNGDGSSFDNIFLNSNSAINNLAGAVFNDATVTGSYAQIAGQTTGTFNNFGTYNKNGAAVTRTSSAIFNNTGTFNVTSGTFDMLTGGTDTGSYNVTAPGVMQFNGGSRTFNAGTSITGTGQTRILSGTLTIPTGVTLNGANVLFSGGTINGDGTLQFVSGDVFTFNGGTFDGIGVLDTQLGSIVNMNGDNVTFSNSHVWNNAGTVNWAGNGSSFDSIFLNSNSTINNLASGVFNDTTVTGSYAQIAGQTTGTFNNIGTYNKNGAAVTRTSSAIFNNTGTFNVTNGTFNMLTGGTDTGNYNVTTPGIMQFNGGGRTFNAGTSITGTGQTRILSGTLTIPTGVTLNGANVLFSGGTINGDGTLQFVSGDVFTFNGGTFDGIGVLDTQLGSIVNMNGDNVTFSNGHVWNNTGTVNWAGDGSSFDNIFLNSNSIINNLASGVFNDSTVTGSYAQIAGQTTGTFNNIGTYNKNGASVTRTSSATFNNTGIFNVTDGTFNMQTGGTDTGSYNVAAPGIMQFNGGSRTLNVGASFTGAGQTRILSGTLTIPSGVTINGTNTLFSGGTVNGGGTFQISSGNTFTFNGGTFDGAGLLDSQTGSTVNLNGDNVIFSNGFIWNNAGVVNWNGNGSSFDTITFNTSSAFNNLASGVFNDNTLTTSYAQMAGQATGSFNNLGIFTKNGSSQTRTSTLPFNNSGTINILDGTLYVITTGTESGTYNVTTPGIVNFGASTRTLSTGTTFTGTGQVQFTGAALTIPSGVSITFSNLLMNAGIVNGDGALVIPGGSTFTFNAGTFDGVGVLENQTGSIVNLNGDNVILSNGRVWNNAGTVNWNGNGSSFDSITLNGTSVFNNLAGAIFNDNTVTSSYAQLAGQASGSFNNQGVFNKNGSSQTRTSTLPFNNSGTVNIIDGTFYLTTTGTESGTYDITSPGILNFGASSRTLSAGTSFIGSGQVQFTGATLTIPTGVSITTSDLLMTAGTVNGEGTLIIPGGSTFTFNAGTFDGAGILENQTGSIVNLNGDNVILSNGRVWNNAGTINWNGNGSSFDTITVNSSSALNNIVGAVFNDNTITSSYAQLAGQATGSFNNQGVYNKNSASQTRTSTLPFSNTGTVNILDGTLYLITTGTESGTYDIANPGILNFGAATRIFNSSSTFTGTGQVQFTGATITIPTGVSLSISDLLMNAGTVNGDGTLVLPSGAVFDFGGGTFDGAGVLDSQAGSTVTIGADNVIFSNGRVWNNAGTINWNGNGSSFDTLTFNSASTFNNLQGGVFNDNTVTGSYAQIVGQSDAQFNNAGIINKVGASATRISTVQMSNTGQLNLNAGVLDLFSLANGTGSYVLAAGSTLNINGGASFGHPDSISGSGQILFNSTVDFTGSIHVTVNGSGTEIIDAGPLSLISFTQPTNGAIVDNGDGTLTYTPTAEFSGPDSFTLVLEDSFGNPANSATINVDVSVLTFNWTGGGTSLWSDPVNWGGTLPSDGSNVIIGTQGGITIIYDETAGSLNLNSLVSDESLTIGGGSLLLGDSAIDLSSFASGTTLTLDGGDFGGAGNIDVSGNFNWLSGNLTGTGSISTLSGSIATLSGSLLNINNAYVWSNAGTLNWNGSGAATDSLFISGNSQLINLSGGVFSDNTASTSFSEVSGESTSSFINQGDYLKISATESRITGLEFRNESTANINSGVLVLQSDGQDSGTYQGNGELNIVGGTRTLATGSVINMASNLVLSGGNILSASGSSINAPVIQLAGANWDLSTGTEVTFGNLQILSGLLTANDNVVVNASFTWSGGSLGGNGSFTTANSSISTLNGDLISLQANKQWFNSGVINWQGDGGEFDTFSFASGAELRNLAGAVFNDATGATTYANLGDQNLGGLINSGVINKANASTTQINTATFNNDGLVNIQSGILETLSTLDVIGAFDIASGARLNIKNTADFIHFDSLLGLGEVSFDSAVNFTISQTGVANEAQTFTIDSGPIVLVSFTQPANGTLVDNGDNTLTYTPDLNFSGDTDSLTLVIHDSFGNAAQSAQVNITIPITIFTWAGGATGSWSDPTNWGGTVPTAGSDVIISDETGLTIVFDETAGSLFLNSIDSTASISISGGTLTLGNDITDTSNFAVGTGLSLDGGAFGGDGTINVNGDFTWGGGTLSGSGNINLANATSVTVSDQNNLTLDGLTVVVDSLALTTQVITLNSGQITANTTSIGEGSSLILDGGSISSQSLLIDGALLWSAGDISVSSQLQIGAGAVVSADGTGSLDLSGASATNLGTLVKTNVGTLSLNADTFTNQGNITVQNGVLDLGASYIQDAGILTLDNGTLLAGNLNMNAGVLAGSGVITGNLVNNGATLVPGFSPGAIFVNGDFTQTSGTLVMELAGTGVGQFDQIKVTGTAILGGELQILPLSPYLEVAVAGEDFSLIEAGIISGEFTTVTAPAGYSYSSSFNAGIMTLNTLDTPATIVAQPEPEPEPVIEEEVIAFQDNEVVTLQEQVVLVEEYEVVEAVAEEESTESNEEEKKEVEEEIAEDVKVVEKKQAPPAEVCQ